MTLTPLLLSSLFAQCAPDVAPATLHALVKVESAAKPYAVANVTDNTSHFFDDKNKAISFLNTLSAQGKDYSAGLMQINARNFNGMGLTNETVFDHCTNIRAGAKILSSCYARALKNSPNNEQKALLDAVSCFYSGNFKRGYKKESTDGKSYIERIKANATVESQFSVPSIATPGQPSQPGTVSSSTFMVNESDNSEWDVFNDYIPKKEQTTEKKNDEGE